MPAKLFYLHDRVNKAVSRLPISIQNKIDQAFDRIKENPLVGTKLHGALSGHYKYRVGDYRIIYSFSSKESMVTVAKVEHRQGIYK